MRDSKGCDKQDNKKNKINKGCDSVFRYNIQKYTKEVFTMSEPTIEKVLKEFIGLGKAILAYQKEYGDYDIANSTIQETMAIDDEKEVICMVDSPSGIEAVLENPAEFLRDIQSEWRRLEERIEYNIEHDILPRCGGDKEEITSTKEDKILV